MQLNKYEVFSRVVELGSLSRAADSMGYTQSAVSHILRSLEDELGFSLLLRSRAGVRLTDAGERLLPAVRNVLASQEQLTQIVSSIHGMEAGTVRIGTFTSVAVHWLPEIIKEFQTRYPHIEFKLLNGDYYDVEQWLREGAIDVGFVHMPVVEGFECVPLVEDPLLAVLPCDHPMAGMKKFPLRQVSCEDFISLPESSSQDAMQAIGAVGAQLNIKYTTKDDYAIIAMVEHGLGMSIMPKLLLTDRSDRVKTMELDPPSSRVIGLAYRSGGSVGPAASSFVEYVLHWAAERYGNVSR